MVERRAPPRVSQAGFMLTETLATFAISAFVLLGLVSASSVLLRAVDRDVARVQDVDALSRTLAAIARDVSGLARARFDGVEPRPFVFQGGPNSLFFAHRETGRDGLPETVVIALREIVAGAGTRLVRADARLSAATASFGELHYGPARDLATGPARLRFSYVARSAPGAPEPSPQRAWASGRTLPAALVVEAVGAADGRPILSTRVPIRANGDIGCLNDAGPSPGALPTPPASGPSRLQDTSLLALTAVASPASSQPAPPGPPQPGPTIGGPVGDDFCAAGRARQEVAR